MIGKMIAAAVVVAWSGLWGEAHVSANFLLFGPTVEGVTDERLQALSEVRTDGDKRAVTTIYLPIFEEDQGQYDKVRELLDQHHFQVFCTTPMSAGRDITSLNDTIGQAGVAFLKEKVRITKKLGGKVLTGALLFPELKGKYLGIRPLKQDGKALEPPHLNHLVNMRLRKAVSRMQEVVDYAATLGILVVNEYINHWEICGGNTLSSAIAFALEVDRLNFGILSDISHEVMQGKGPFIYAGELQFAKNHGIPLFFQLSEPGRGDIVHSWIPFDQFFGTMQALDLIDADHPIDIEIFDAVAPYNSLLQLTREPFTDQMQVMLEGVRYTHQRFAQVPDAAKIIPQGALEAASALIVKERQETYWRK